MRYLFSLITLAIIILLQACNDSEVTENKGLITPKDSTPYVDSIPLQNALINYSDEDLDTLKLDFGDFEMQFPGLYVYTEGNAVIVNDTTELYIELTSKIDTFLVRLKNEQIKSYAITEQYQNIVSVSDEGPHVELYEWKNYKSEWFNVDTISNGIFLMKNISEEESMQFPKYTRQELILYLKANAGQNWANIISKPETGKWTDQFWIGVGVRRVFIKMVLADGTEITKLLVIYPAMGC
ncbi:MAG: hypothetical protein V4580_08325 [Bacteroidota bacterium]